MTKFLDKSFSVHMGTDQEYRDNWDACFSKDKPVEATPNAGVACAFCERFFPADKLAEHVSKDHVSAPTPSLDRDEQAAVDAAIAHENDCALPSSWPVPDAELLALRELACLAGIVLDVWDDEEQETMVEQIDRLRAGYLAVMQSQAAQFTSPTQEKP